MFKFGIKEEVITPKKVGDINKIGIIRGRAEYQGYGEFSYLVQMPPGEKTSIEGSDDNLDFGKCTWFTESKLNKL